MLGLFFYLFLYIDHQKQGTLYFADTKLFNFFSRKLFINSTFCNFLKRIAKIMKYLKAVEIKIFNLSFWKKTCCRNINNLKVGAVFFLQYCIVNFELLWNNYDDVIIAFAMTEAVKTKLLYPMTKIPWYNLLLYQNSNSKVVKKLV